jgi:hypothetical protein
MVSRKSLPDKLLFLALVRHLDLDEREWTGRWEEYDRARTHAARIRTTRRDPVVPGEGGVHLPQRICHTSVRMATSRRFAEPPGTKCASPTS